MMRRAVCLSLLLFLVCVLALPVCAQDVNTEKPSDQVEKEVKEGLSSLLPDAAKPLLPDPTDSEAVTDALHFQALFSLFTDALEEEGAALGGKLLTLIAITFLFAAISLFVKERARTTTVFLECSAALCIFTLLLPTAERIFSFFEDLQGVTAGLSPVMITLFASGGGTSSAGAASMGFASFSSLLSLFAESVFPPLLRVLLALSLLSALGNHHFTAELSRRMSGLALFLLSTLSMLFLASLAFESALASSADSVALRTVKYTATNAIPVVGGTVSGALGALHASLSLLRSAAGGTAVIALLVLLLPPLVEVFLLRLMLSFCESIAAFMGALSLRDTLGRFRSVFDFALASLVLVSVLFLITVGIFSHLSPFSG